MVRKIILLVLAFSSISSVSFAAKAAIATGTKYCVQKDPEATIAESTYDKNVYLEARRK